MVRQAVDGRRLTGAFNASLNHISLIILSWDRVFKGS